MSSGDAQWAELKEFEQCEPGPLAFRALVGLLDTWAGDDQAAAIEYAATFLSRWPDADRLAPWSWCKAAAKGAVPPSWPLVRTLQLTTKHLTKSPVNLARLAQRAELDLITQLEIPSFSGFKELSFLYHRPEVFPSLKTLRASDEIGGPNVRVLAGSPMWRTLESFDIGELSGSPVRRKDASRIVPKLEAVDRVRHLTLRSRDLVALWQKTKVPHLRSAGVIIRSIDEALTLATRPELAQLTSLSIAFRCGFSGSAPWEPFLGNVIEADEAAAEAFFAEARLDRLEELSIVGYAMGCWGREGLGRLGLDALVASGLLQRLKRLRLQLLPLGDAGVATLAPALGKRLETLELVDLYCKGEGAAALTNSPCLPSLRHLDLSANRIDAESFARMAGVDMPHLQSLDLSGPHENPYYWWVGQQPLLDAGAAAWANSANVRGLKRLRMRNCYLSDEALAAIFRSPQLRSLEELDLSHNAFTAPAIAQAVVGSPLWQALTDLGLNRCRLDDAAIEALCQVDQAPALRSLHLAYNSIGPRGAAALAAWPALARAWQLDLHDNFIGHDGLIALARSPHLGRLLELDLEQDCWNSRTLTFSDDAARALADSGALPRLEALFTGCVDEYHGTAYAPGFSKEGLDLLRKAEGKRPAFRASCSDFSGISDYIESAERDEHAEIDDHDFRSRPYTLDEQEAEAGERRMQQLSSRSDFEEELDDEEPPDLEPRFEEDEDLDDDIIEGLEYRDPTLSADLDLDLNLSLDDGRRRIPGQVGKLLVDTLGSLFKACAIGGFAYTGGSSRQDEDGQTIEVSASFSVGIKGEPEPALRLIRETLWWIGAPEETQLSHFPDDLTGDDDAIAAQIQQLAARTAEQFPLDLTVEPTDTTAHFLQLAAPTIFRWQMGHLAGHRIDRVPFTPAQRQDVRRILTDAGADAANGWLTVEADDGGRMKVFVKYLDEGPEFDTLNLLIDALTPEVSALVHRLMHECALMAWPMAFAASADAAQPLDCDWPQVEVVASAATLHELLARGPYHWWNRDPSDPAVGH